MGSKGMQFALWVGYRIDPLPCHACRKRRLRQEQLAPRIKGWCRANDPTHKKDVLLKLQRQETRVLTWARKGAHLGDL